jgi:hypothetical protein
VSVLGQTENKVDRVCKNCAISVQVGTSDPSTCTGDTMITCGMTVWDRIITSDVMTFGMERTWRQWDKLLSLR